SLPLPMSSVFSICRSGRSSAPAGWSALPGVAPLGADPPSTTITNCPDPVSKICRPNVSNIGVGVGVVTQLTSQQKAQPSEFLITPKNTTRGPGLVGVGLAVRLGVGVSDGDALVVGERVDDGVRVGDAVGVTLLVRVGVRVGVAVAVLEAVALWIGVRVAVAVGVALAVRVAVLV